MQFELLANELFANEAFLNTKLFFVACPCASAHHILIAKWKSLMNIIIFNVRPVSLREALSRCEILRKWFTRVSKRAVEIRHNNTVNFRVHTPVHSCATQGRTGGVTRMMHPQCIYRDPGMRVHAVGLATRSRAIVPRVYATISATPII